MRRGFWILLLVALACLLGWSRRGPPPRATLCLSVLDVGQGDALLLEFPAGEAWLVDGGGIPGSRRDMGEMVVLPALRRRGIDRVDLVVLTHGDADHSGGLGAVLEQLEVGALLVPRDQGVGGAERALTALAVERGVPVLVGARGPELPALGGGARAQLLHPAPGWDGGGSSNDGSVVLRVGLGAVSMLLTGDLEAPGEGQLLARSASLEATVLKLGHHGSRTSSSPELLDAVNPLLAVAGVGRDNRFGFPHAAVTGRLRERGIPLWTTAAQGEHRVCTDGLGAEVEVRGASGWEGVAQIGPEAVAQHLDAADRVQRKVVELARGASPEGETREAKRRPRRKASRSRRARTKVASVSSKAPGGGGKVAEPEPPLLLQPRDWDKHRRARSRPRAPWKSR